LAGQPYLLLLRWRSMSHRRLKAFPHEGQRCVPRWMWRWCWSEPETAIAPTSRVETMPTYDFNKDPCAKTKGLEIADRL
jgi:hypothetical protein